MKSIGIIDCYMISPAINCFNQLVKELPAKLFYHLPGQHQLSTLTNAEHDAYIILGSASHVHQNLEWHYVLAQFIDSKLKQNKPVIGCCFGHQLMANYYGSKIKFYYDDENKITGTRNVVIEKDLGAIKSGNKLKLGVTHRQIVDTLSDEFESLTPSSTFKNDIIQHKKLPFLGLQAHPEASLYFLEKECFIQEPNDRMEAHENGLKIIQEFFKIYNIW